MILGQLRIGERQMTSAAVHIGRHVAHGRHPCWTEHGGWEKMRRWHVQKNFRKPSPSLTSKTLPLHANAPGRPKTVQNDKKSLGDRLNEVKKPNQRFQSQRLSLVTHGADQRLVGSVDGSWHFQCGAPCQLIRRPGCRRRSWWWGWWGFCLNSNLAKTGTFKIK